MELMGIMFGECTIGRGPIRRRRSEVAYQVEIGEGSGKE
jgi:hypothetical protein